MFRLTSPEEERSAWRTALRIMLFFCSVAFSLQVLNFFGGTTFPMFTAQFMLSLVYTPTAVLGVGWASPSLMRLGGRSRFFLITLAAYLVCDILLTPFGGLETRSIGGLTTIGSVTPWLFYAGFALVVISTVLLFSRPRISPFLAIPGAVLYFPAFLADQTGLFAGPKPPLGVATLELIQALVAAIMMLLAFAMP